MDIGGICNMHHFLRGRRTPLVIKAKKCIKNAIIVKPTLGTLTHFRNLSMDVFLLWIGMSYYKGKPGVDNKVMHVTEQNVQTQGDNNVIYPFTSNSFSFYCLVTLAIGY